jgi:hypothetical protein
MKNPINYYTDTHGQKMSFHIPDDISKLCINLSGGADSAMLGYMTIKYCEQYIPDAEIHIITCANQPKGWYNAKFSSNVIDRLLQITKTNMIKSHYTYFADDQRRTDLNIVEFKMAHLGTANFFIHGTTQNPPLTEENLLEGRFKPRDAGHNRFILRDRINNWRYMPLMYVDKRMVAYLYNHFEMMELLLPYTRSCEQASRHNHDTPVWMVSECGECWWCREREWAFRSTT